MQQSKFPVAIESGIREFLLLKQPDRYPGKARAYKPRSLRIFGWRAVFMAVMYAVFSVLSFPSVVSLTFVGVVICGLATATYCLLVARVREREDVAERQQAKGMQPACYAVDYTLIRAPGGETICEVYTTDFREIESRYADGLEVGGRIDTRVIGGDYGGTHWLNVSIDEAAWVHKLVAGALGADSDPREWVTPSRDPKDMVGETRLARAKNENALASAVGISVTKMGVDDAYDRLGRQRMSLLAHYDRVKKLGVRGMGGQAAFAFQIENVEKQLDECDAAIFKLLAVRDRDIGFVGASDEYPAFHATVLGENKEGFGA